MSLELSLNNHVLNADNDIINITSPLFERSKINLTKGIVVEKYQPLFDKVKEIALVYMKQNNVGELTLIPNVVYFRSDGNFYRDPSSIQPINFEGLPTWYCMRSESKDIKMIPGSTEYHSQMQHTFNGFKKRVQESLAFFLS